MSAPLVSVFTPTHNPQHLLETYRSLRDQTFTAFEWVLVPNRGAVIPEEILADSRVVLQPFPGGAAGLAPGVGALKQFACRKCRGQLLVELDHDDLLIESALQEIVEAWQETKAGFLYSDFVQFYPDGSPHIWDTDGWEHYPVRWQGRTCAALRAFDPCPYSLSLVYYAPNHVRVWDREVYEAVKGHDPLLAICDDHDLIVRTYLSGAGFHHIPRPLYWYREHGKPGDSKPGNTYLARLPEIQKATQRIGNASFHKLVYEWVRRSATRRLQLLGVSQPIADHEQVTVTDWLATRRLPGDDNSVGAVHAYDFLQRVPQEDRVAIMNEIYRVLQPGGFLLARIPSATGMMADADPTALSRWNRLSFQYYCNRGLSAGVPGLAAAFQDTRVWDEYLDDWHRQNQMLHTYAEISAMKGQRQAGRCYC